MIIAVNNIIRSLVVVGEGVGVMDHILRSPVKRK